MSNLDKKIIKAEIKDKGEGKSIIEDKEEGESIINENKEVETNSSKKNYVLKTEDLGENLIDNLFYNILNLEEYWNEYFESLCEKAYISPVEQEKRENLKSNMENNLGVNLEEYRQWKEEYQIKEIQDLIPIQNVGIMLEVLEQLEEVSINEDTMICDYFKSIINIMKNIFLKAEKYCQVDFIEGNIKKSSFVLSKLLVIIKDLYEVLDWQFMDYFSIDVEIDTTT